MLMQSDIAVQFRSLPAPLLALPRWILWSLDTVDEHNQPRPKPAKVPYSISGRHASTTDPSTWASWPAVLDLLISLAPLPPGVGPGFVLTREDQLIGIDLDHAAVDGVLAPWAETVIAEANSYTEWSPSGNGLHIFVRGTLPAGCRHKQQMPDGGVLELWDRARYLTATGRHLAGTPREVNAVMDLSTFLQKWMPAPVRVPPRRPQSLPVSCP